MNLQANQHRKDCKYLEVKEYLSCGRCLLNVIEQISVLEQKLLLHVGRFSLLGGSKTHEASKALLYKHKINSFNKYV